jgi:hypothetical protein
MISLAPDLGTLTSIDTRKDFRRRKLILGIIWVANLEKEWNSWMHIGAVPCFGFLSHLLTAHNSIIKRHIFMLDGAL